MIQTLRTLCATALVAVAVPAAPALAQNSLPADVRSAIDKAAAGVLRNGVEFPTPDE